MAIFFTHATKGAIGYDGKQSIAANGTFNYSHLTHQLTAVSGSPFSAYTLPAGSYDYIYLAKSPPDGIWVDGLYCIVAKIDNSTVELGTWDSAYSYGDSEYLAKIPGILPASTTNSTSGVTSGTGPKATVGQGAALMLTAGDQLHIGGAMSDFLQTPRAGASGTPMVYWGYNTFPGDGIPATITVSSSYAIEVQNSHYYQIFRNLSGSGATVAGFYQGTSTDRLVQCFDVGFTSCQVGADVMGIIWNGGTLSGNTSYGLKATRNRQLDVSNVVCVNNGNAGIATNYGGMITNVLVWGNTGQQIWLSSGFYPSHIYGSTIDADGENYGILCDDKQPIYVEDSIIVNASLRAIHNSYAKQVAQSYGKNLCVWNNNSDFNNNFRCVSGLIEDNPLLTANYGVGIASPCIGAGVNGRTLGYRETNRGRTLTGCAFQRGFNE